MPELRVIVNGETTDTFPLDGETVTIGRDGKNTIVILDPTASSFHAQIALGSDGWSIEDLNSTNGTVVNGWPIESVALNTGDLIKIGSVELRFAADDADDRDSEDYLQSMLTTFGAHDNDDGLPSVVIDSLDALQDGDPGMSFISIEGTQKAQDAAPQNVLMDAEKKSPLVETVVVKDRLPVSGSDDSANESMAETKLRLVQRVSEQLIRIFDPQELLDEIMTIVVEQTGADRGLLCLFDDKRQPIPIAARNFRPGEEARVSRTALTRLFHERTGVLINASADEEPSVYQSLADMAVQSTMCVPLWTGDRIAGILSLDLMNSQKAFNQQDLELLLAVAHPVAVGIERNRLSHQIETERRMRDYMSKYLDHRVVEQIRRGQSTGNDPLAPTENEVTILFSDIVSFTKLSESLSAVEVAEFMRKYLTSMTDVVFSYGGTIDKYIGDALMALFGAPVPSEDSAAAAIRTALAMRENVKQFDLPGAKGKSLRIRVGINTGTVVVGNLGSERRAEYTALGDAVNVASRLETFARPHEICIDEYTYEKTKDAFEVEEIGTIDVKNRAEPVIVYKVIAEQK